MSVIDAPITVDAWQEVYQCMDAISYVPMLASIPGRTSLRGVAVKAGEGG